jgi:prepilin-type N-terminal cleavage/methylation domain-containing protein
MRFRRVSAFTLIEVLISIGILALLSAVVFVFVVPALGKARDARRKLELSTLGRYLVLSCPLPSEGFGDYDLAPLINDLKASNPRFADSIPVKPKDPLRGTESETLYRYIVADSAAGKRRICALYANLEYGGEPVTLGISAPTPGGGTGVFSSSAPGPNGSNRYYQISN